MNITTNKNTEQYKTHRQKSFGSVQRVKRKEWAEWSPKSGL